jgi:methyltransferase
MLIRAIVCGAMGLARLVELVHSRRNLENQGPVEEGEGSRRTFPIMVALHTTVIAGTFLAGGRPRPLWLTSLALLQPLRLWVLVTLGGRWSARGTVATELTVATEGPYAYLRHPNYAVVLGELVFLPLAFGLKRLALLGFAVNAALLAVRIHDEESLLVRQPGYREHFADKKRLIPGLI